VYEGRGWDRVGAHSPNYNSVAIGVSIIGSYTSRNPNAAALTATQQLISCGISRVCILITAATRGRESRAYQPFFYIYSPPPISCTPLDSRSQTHT